MSFIPLVSYVSTRHLRTLSPVPIVFFPRGEALHIHHLDYSAATTRYPCVFMTPAVSSSPFESPARA